MKKQFYKCLLFIAVLITGTQMAQAQQKIGTNPGTLEPSAVLELGSSDAAGAKKGFLGPKVNLPSATTYSLGPAGTAAVDGMIVYAIGTTGLPAGYYFWQNAKWNLIQTGSSATTNALTNTGTAAAPTLTSTVNGVASAVTLPTASATNTGLLSNTDFATFNSKENALTFSNGLTRSANAISLGGSITGATSLTLGANNLTFNASSTGKLIVSGAAGNTAGLQLSNLTGAGTAGTVGQKVLSVDASGNVVLVTDFGAAATATTNTLANTGTATAPTLTSTVNGVAAAITLPTASATNTGLLSNADYATFNGKENVLSFTNGLTRSGNAISLGGTVGAATTLTLGANNITVDASGAGQFVVGAAAGNTSGLRLSNLTGTATAGTVGQKVLSVDASGDVVLVSDFGTANAGTVTSVGLAAPSIFTTGAAITSSGNLTLGLATQSPNLVWAGPASGTAAAVPSFRALGLADLNSISVAGDANKVLTVDATGSPVWTLPTAASFGGWGLTGNTIAASTPIANRRLGTVSNYSLPIITNNVERMRVDSLGNVGIGTLKPETKLHVVNSAAVAAVKFESVGVGTGPFPIVSVTANATGATLSDGFGPQFNLAIQKGTATEINLARISAVRDGADNTGAITFGTSTLGTISERMRIDGTRGRVGINNSTPQGRLHIQGSAVDGDTLLWLGTERPFFFAQRGLGASSYLDLRSTVDKSFTITSNAGLEILKVNPSANALNTVVEFLGGYSRLAVDRGHYQTGVRLGTADTLELQTGNNANQIALLPNGFVSIGSYGSSTIIKPTPTSTLDVNGSVSHSINKITASTTLGASHYTVLANATSAGFTITLPTASTVTGRVYVIRKTDETSNVITFAETGNATTSIIKVTETSFINTLNYVKTLRIQSDGTNWQLID